MRRARAGSRSKRKGFALPRSRDASRLERVIANLLTNALKYSADDAPVTVRLTRRTGSIELDVIDRGIGIAPESLNRLFERYFRTAAGKAHASGLGLGLYIARLIAEAHGGESRSRAR